MESLFASIAVIIIVLYFAFYKKGPELIDRALYKDKRVISSSFVLRPIKTEPTAASEIPEILEQVFHPRHYVPKRLMTPSEEYFFKQLTFVSSEKYYIFPQVHLNSLMQPGYTSDTLAWHRENNRINRKSVDFVVFTKSDIKPVLVIELDDFTHKWYKRIKRDGFVDECMHAVGIPIIHVFHRHINIEDRNRIMHFCS